MIDRDSKISGQIVMMYGSQRNYSFSLITPSELGEYVLRVLDNEGHTGISTFGNTPNDVVIKNIYVERNN